MKRFQFRLQTVLEHRQRKETIAHLNYGEAQSHLKKGMEMLRELEEEQEAVTKELSDRRLSGNFDPLESQTYHEYLNTLRKCIEDQNNYVADLSSTAEALRLHLVGVSQERQVLDRMRTKAKNDHIQAAIKVEQLASDDMSSSRRVYQAQQGNQE